MTPSIGRTVHYCLSELDAEQINRRRTDGPTIARRMKNLHWHAGAQAHIGNPARAGQVLPMIIVSVDPPADPDVSAVSGQVFLDGTDVFWAQHVGQVAAGSSDKQGCWFEPPRVAAAATPEVTKVTPPAGSEVNKAK